MPIRSSEYREKKKQLEQAAVSKEKGGSILSRNGSTQPIRIPVAKPISKTSVSSASKLVAKPVIKKSAIPVAIYDVEEDTMLGGTQGIQVKKSVQPTIQSIKNYSDRCDTDDSDIDWNPLNDILAVEVGIEEHARNAAKEKPIITSVGIMIIGRSMLSIVNMKRGMTLEFAAHVLKEIGSPCKVNIGLTKTHLVIKAAIDDAYPTYEISDERLVCAAQLIDVIMKRFSIKLISRFFASFGKCDIEKVGTQTYAYIQIVEATNEK